LTTRVERLTVLSETADDLEEVHLAGPQVVEVQETELAGVSGQDRRKLVRQKVAPGVQYVRESPVPTWNGQELVLAERVERRRAEACGVPDDLHIAEVDSLHHIAGTRQQLQAFGGLIRIARLP